MSDNLQDRLMTSDNIYNLFSQIIWKAIFDALRNFCLLLGSFDIPTISMKIAEEINFWNINFCVCLTKTFNGSTCKGLNCMHYYFRERVRSFNE